jgi:type IV pilus assembly protein PilM
VVPDDIGFCYSGNSSYQMLKRQVREGTNVFIQLNEQDTVISILHDNILILQRTIGYGISTLIETVMEQKCFMVHNEMEAMELLHNKNLLDLENAEQVNDFDNSREGVDAQADTIEASNQMQDNSTWQLSEAAATSEFICTAEVGNMAEEMYEAKKNVIESLQFLTNSISRMLDYYKNNHRNVVFESIHLSGFGIRIRGIERLFSQRIGIDNRKLEKLYTVSAKENAQAYLQNPSEFMACVGSVIKPVDFIPKELIERRQRIQTMMASAFLILLCIGGTAELCYISYSDYLTAKNEYNKATEQLEVLPDTSAVMAEHDKASERLEDLQKMEAAMQTNDRINEVISALEKNMISNAKIQSMQFSDTDVVMNVIMSDNKYGANTLVAKLLMQMKNIELFETVQDSNMSVSDMGEISLTISCTYKQIDASDETE